MADDAIAYLKAVDQQQRLGSNASTATGAVSTPSSMNSLAHTPLSSSTSLTRTPLSSQAEPFVSSGLLTGALTHIGWMPVVVNMQDGSSQQGRSQTQSYYEKTQEDLYLISKEEPACEASQFPKWYCETLQENIYCAEETVVRGYLSTHDERMVMQARNPSPLYASPSFPNVETADTSRLLDASETLVEKVDEANNDGQDLQAEVSPIRKIHRRQTFSQHPVKHTFIHYDDGQPKRFVKSASSPSILLHNAFYICPMSELHGNGQCSPCLYFRHKGDGCRQGSECRFCHLCTPDEIKQHRKTKLKESRARKRVVAFQNMEASSLTLSQDPALASK